MITSTARDRNAPNIRMATHDDLPRLVEIYNQAIELRNATGDLEPFTIAEREGWFASHDPARAPIHVAELDGRVVGYNTLTNYREGRAAFRHAMETSYFVDAAARRRGVASALLADTMGSCAALGVTMLVCYLLDHNLPSRRFLERHGFALWGTLPGAGRIDGVERAHLIYGRRVD